MRRHRSSIAVVAVIALLAACSREDATSAPPTEPVPSTNPDTAAVTPVGYACESGKTISVQYIDTTTAQLIYQSQAFTLTSAKAASGARYVGQGLEWWTASRDGQESVTLSRVGPEEEVGGAVLERCSRPTPGVGEASMTPPMTTPTGPVAPPVPAPGGVLPAAMPCTSAQLKLSAEGGDAGMGHRLATLAVKNTGPQACSITGYPTISLLNGRGRPLTTIRIDKHPGSYLSSGGAPRPVELASQSKGYFDLAWTVVPNEGNGETVCPNAATVRFSAPGDSGVVAFAQAFTPCGGRMDVSPVRPTAEDVAPG